MIKKKLPKDPNQRGKAIVDALTSIVNEKPLKKIKRKKSKKNT